MASIKVSRSVFDSDEKRAAFVEGWKEAGGYMGDAATDSPWCAPWTWAGSITVDLDAWCAEGGADAYRALGAAYWKKVGGEVIYEIEKQESAKRWPNGFKLNPGPRVYETIHAAGVNFERTEDGGDYPWEFMGGYPA